MNAQVWITATTNDKAEFTHQSRDLAAFGKLVKAYRDEDLYADSIPQAVYVLEVAEPATFARRFSATCRWAWACTMRVVASCTLCDQQTEADHYFQEHVLCSTCATLMEV